MKKTINQGTTLFVVSGLNVKDAKFSLLYVNKKAIISVEEERFYSKYIGTKQVTITQKDIEKMDGIEKLLAMGSGLSRTIYIQEQGINKVIKPHIIIYDRNNNEYDIDAIWTKDNPQYFRSRKSANRYYKKLMDRRDFILIDESSDFFQENLNQSNLRR